ncbi:MAG TPA: hypothetical protein VMA32_04780 [Streptosporangiaceae bacterium]|nr:hypothetical protein [Streptosporangiaceae bacterium]
MASSAAKLLRATAESNRTALTSAAAQELASLTRQRVVPLQPSGNAAAQPAGDAAARPPAPPAQLAPAAPPIRATPVAIPRRRSRSARRWQLTGMLLALAVVAGSVAIAMALRHSPAPSTGRTTPEGGSKQIGTASLIRGQAAAWVVSQVGRNIEIACDAATCSDLAQHGFPPGNLNVLQPTAPDPYGSELVIATASVRSQFGSKLATVYAPEVIASFGSGPDRIDVRLVAANGPAAFERSLQADLQARKSSGAELLRNRRIVTSAADRAQLRAGQVDLRLLTTLAFMAGEQHLKIVDFGSIAPGAGPGVPLRFADLAATDPAGRMKSAAYVRALLTLVHAEQPPYVPLSAGSVRLSTGQTVLRIEFAAPSPLGLLSS